MRWSPQSAAVFGIERGQTVEVVEGPLKGCLATVREPVGLRAFDGDLHNCVRAVVCRRSFTLPETYLRATNKTEGATL